MSYFKAKSLFSLILFTGVIGSLGLLAAGCGEEPISGMTDYDGTATAAEAEAPAPPQMPQFEQPPQPDPLEREDLVDEDFPADTVLAEVNASEITVRDIHDFILDVPAPHQLGLVHRQHEILDELISRKVLMEQAGELEIDETDEYDATLQMMEQQGVPNPEEEAMINALFQKEVVAKVEISEDDLRELYDEHKDMLPEDISYEQIRPNLREMMLFEHINDYISKAQEGADIEKNEDWIAAQETLHRQMMEDMQGPDEWVN